MAGKRVFLLLGFLVASAVQTLRDDIEARSNAPERSLSRKRRYLIFPEGSSLQLVFCFTMPSIGVGQIFTIGSTVALAWELPHDPFEPFRRPSELLHRVDKPQKHTSGGWTVQNGNSPPPVTYKKTRYNPFLVDRPLGYTTINALYQNVSGPNHGLTKTKTNYGPGRSHSKKYNQITGYRKEYHEPVTTYLHPVYHKIYRRTRRDLYSKIERMFTGLSKDGRACLLKAVCEVSKATKEKGTFMEEIVKAIFRVRHHQDDGVEERDEYDMAANKQHNCTEMYSSCEHSIWGSMFSFPANK